MNRPMILAALAVTATLAGAAYAQQAIPYSPPGSDIQQRGDRDDAGRDDREPRGRWQRDRDDGRGDRGSRRRPDEDRMGHGDRTGFGPMGRMCGQNGGRFAERMMERIERATRPTTEQKPALDALKEASNKAAEIVKAACPTEQSVTPPGRLAAAEKRLTAMLEAVRTVRPAMDAYYSTLSDEQKARLLMSRRAMNPDGDRDGGWRGRDRDRDRGGDRRGWRNGDGDGDRRGRSDRGRDRDEDGDERGGRGSDRTGNDATKL